MTQNFIKKGDEIMKQQPIKIYARCNNAGHVERFLETAHHREEILETDILLEEGYGDYYAYPHARAENPLIAYDADLCHNWVLDGEKIRKATKKEKEAELQARPQPEPSAQEDLMAMAVDMDYRLTLLELGV